MIQSMPPLLRTILFLNLLALALVLLAAYWPVPGEGARDLPEMETAITEERSEDQLQNVSEVLERPLFHENRREVSVEARAPVLVQVPPDMPFTLVGIVGNASAGRTAYLFHEQRQETVSVKEGETGEGWLVVHIEEGAVLLEREGLRRRLDIEGGR